MKRTITELQYLLNILYDVYRYSPRNYRNNGKKYDNYYSYPLALFEHGFQGRPIVDKLAEIDFISLYTEKQKRNESFPEKFIDGRCVIIDEENVSFHYNMSQILLCYTGYLLRNDLIVVIAFFRDSELIRTFHGSNIDENNSFNYSYMVQNDIWERLRLELKFPSLTFHFLYRITQYAGFKNMTTMEIQLGKIDRLLNEHILSYDFTSLDKGVILDEEN